MTTIEWASFSFAIFFSCRYLRAYKSVLSNFIQFPNIVMFNSTIWLLNRLLFDSRTLWMYLMLKVVSVFLFCIIFKDNIFDQFVVFYSFLLMFFFCSIFFFLILLSSFFLLTFRCCIFATICLRYWEKKRDREKGEREREKIVHFISVIYCQMVMKMYCQLNSHFIFVKYFDCLCLKLESIFFLLFCNAISIPSEAEKSLFVNFINRNM